MIEKSLSHALNRGQAKLPLLSKTHLIKGIYIRLLSVLQDSSLTLMNI